MFGFLKLIFVFAVLVTLLCYHDWRLLGSAMISSFNFTLALMHRLPKQFHGASLSTVSAILFDGIVGLSFICFFVVLMICVIQFGILALLLDFVFIMIVSTFSLSYAVYLCSRQIVDRRQRNNNTNNSNNDNQRRRLKIVVQNVLFDNVVPADCVRQLLSRDADVIVIVESTSSFIALFDEISQEQQQQQQQQQYRYRISNDLSVVNGYAVTMLSRREFVNARIEQLSSETQDSGDFTLNRAEIRFYDDTSLMLLGTNVHTCVDPPYVGRWRKQMQLLSNFLSSVESEASDLLLVGKT